MWCSSAVNRAPFCLSAACRTRLSASCARARPCVRSVLACGEFRLASPSLQSLRGSPPSVVRDLLRYYAAVRLPSFVHQRRAASAFPLRPVRTESDGGTWDLPSCARDGSVHARGLRPRGVPNRLAYRRPGCCLPHEGTASALPTWVLSGLNTRPARAPTNASRPASRLTPHSSGPRWIAPPSG